MVSVAVLTCLVVLQVPPPSASTDLAKDLRRQERAILDRESEALKRQADLLASAGQAEAATALRKFLPAAPPANGASTFVPLPDVVGRKAGLANVPAGVNASARWRADLATTRNASAKALFELANRAATSTPRHYALADACLRAVLERQPDYAEARRLLGFVPHDGGWATPFAVKQIGLGMVLHPTFGWVKSTWLPHLERGELPAPGQRSDRWLPAKEADALRSAWESGWTIDTEHFRIKANVPLSEAIAFGRHLEAFHELFFSMLADVIAEKLPLARRFKEKAAVGETPTEPHHVYYFASRDEYVAHIRPLEGEKSDQSLGLYIPPKSGRRPPRSPAYFFRDPGGELDVTATLYHEVSHQLLFEAGPAKVNDYEKNLGNYWVFEGMGTYFESIVTLPDGSIEVGGKVGRRIEAARDSLVKDRRGVPLAEFVKLNLDRFGADDVVHLHYQQADALATFLMDGRGGEYREDFLTYFADAYHGRLKRNAGRALDDRLGKSYEQIGAELLKYLADDPVKK
jgi:hypothetical protein